VLVLAARLPKPFERWTYSRRRLSFRDLETSCTIESQPFIIFQSHRIIDQNGLQLKKLIICSLQTKEDESDHQDPPAPLNARIVLLKRTHS
jgi:hypothetical protein